jgi:hypothetical protein
MIIHLIPAYTLRRELAALLGQVKPPVASPEEIENSGLQIIKSSDIGRWSDEGKVASNCIDRVCEYLTRD